MKLTCSTLFQILFGPGGMGFVRATKMNSDVYLVYTTHMSQAADTHIHNVTMTDGFSLTKYVTSSALTHTKSMQCCCCCDSDRPCGPGTVVANLLHKMKSQREWSLQPTARQSVTLDFQFLGSVCHMCVCVSLHCSMSTQCYIIIIIMNIAARMNGAAYVGSFSMAKYMYIQIYPGFMSDSIWG